MSDERKVENELTNYSVNPGKTNIGNRNENKTAVVYKKAFDTRRRGSTGLRILNHN